MVQCLRLICIKGTVAAAGAMIVVLSSGAR